MVVKDVNDLPTLYRPDNLNGLLGQEAIVSSLKYFKKVGKFPHAFIFHGDSGVGKTTTARIIAKELKCIPNNIREFDAASHSGVDDIRKIVSTLHFSGIGDFPNKIIIIDECHRLSKQAWDVLLKPIEEPFGHVYFVLCTTEFNKIPKTIKTRCHVYGFKNANLDDLIDLLENINEEEDFELNDKLITYIAKQAEGSYRKAIVNLSACRNADTKEQIAEILSTIADKKDVAELCRLLISGKGTFVDAIKMVKNITQDGSIPPESIRIIIVNYLAAVILKNPDSKNVEYLLFLIDVFSMPYNNSEKLAPIISSLGEIYFQ